MKHRIAVLLMLGMMPWAGANAQTPASTTFKVSATVTAVCGVSAADLGFGTYDSKSAVLGQSGVVVTCTPGSTYNIALNAGAGGGTIPGGRKMTGTPAINTLNYQLYRDSARSQIWGETTGSNTVQDVGTGLAKSHTVFGTIPTAQAVPVGSYQDTITVSVTF